MLLGSLVVAVTAGALGQAYVSLRVTGRLSLFLERGRPGHPISLIEEIVARVQAGFVVLFVFAAYDLCGAWNI